jgi:hypothetical protein
MGSSYFFDKYEDYKSKDYDDLCIMDRFIFEGAKVMNMKIGGRDVFMYKNMDKKGFMDEVFETNVFMKAGKFLIPEFNEYIGFTIEDLEKMRPMFEQIDYRHGYEKIIFEAYLENGGFFLTDEQRDRAYAEYKYERGL